MNKILWEKPEIYNLAHNKTKEDIEPIDKGEHFCHSLKAFHDNGCGPTHTEANGCKGENHDKWNVPQNAKCCCLDELVS